MQIIKLYDEIPQNIEIYLPSHPSTLKSKSMYKKNREIPMLTPAMFMVPRISTYRKMDR